MRWVQYHFGMEIRQLRYLVALAQELSFTKAAALANVAQPALSRQISKLEEELGTPLVDRTSRRVQLTDAGRRLVPRAMSILDEIEDARADILQLTELLAGRLAIGTTQTPGPLDIGRLLSSFHSAHPQVTLSVREELSVMVADRLRADRIDLGFVSEIGEPARRGLELREVASEPLVIAVPADHRLADRSSVSFAELHDEPFVVFPEGATIRTTFDELAAAHGISGQIAFVTTDTNRMRELVALGLGIGLLPESDATRPGHSHVPVLVDGHPLTYRVFLARRQNRRLSAAASAFVSQIETIFQPEATWS